MRTSIIRENSKYRVTIYFTFNGWAISYFDNKEEIDSWIDDMREKYGTIKSIKRKRLTDADF